MTNLVDYRDRASVLVWVVLMGLTAQRFLQLPARTFEGTLFGSPITLTLTANVLLIAVLAALVASGTEAVVRAHPRSRPSTLWVDDPQRAMPARRFINTLLPKDEDGAHTGTQRRAHWAFWGLPIAVVTVAVLLLPLAASTGQWFLGLLLTGVALGVSMAGIYYTVDPFQTGYRRARLGMNALTYVAALLLFLVVYRTRVRSIVSATEVTALSTLLALELLRGSERPTLLVALYAGVTGVVLGEATWTLNYWRLDSLTGGLVLLVLFYDIVGLAQNALQGRINRRVLLEYGLITLAAVALIWEFAP